jgi:hypothetical protein
MISIGIKMGLVVKVVDEEGERGKGKVEREKGVDGWMSG